MRIDARRPAAPLALGIACALILTLAPAALAAQPHHKLPWGGPGVRVKPGSLVVTFASGTSLAQKRAIHDDVGADVAARSPIGIDVVELPAAADPLEAIRLYQADPRVVAAELDRIAVPTEIPNDPHFETQWGLRNHEQPHPITESGYVNQDTAAGTNDADVDADQAWDLTTPGDDVVVAVIDTGVDVDHPDLVDSMWVNDLEQSGTPGVDDDANGRVDDINGWDFRGNDPNPSPANNLGASHGTHVAGIVAAARNDGVGIAGVCEACRIMGLRFDFSLGQEIKAIEYAVENDADVINMSFASGVWSPAERAAIRAAGQAGVLVVVSAGNSSMDNDIPFYVDRSFAPAFPASYNLPTILAVAASNHHNQYALVTECVMANGSRRWICAFTSWGRDSVDLAAPGVDIVSTVVPAAGGDVATGYQVWDGTSMAAPLVAGIAGAVKHEHPTYGPVDLKNALMNSVNRPPGLKLLSSWAHITGVARRPTGGLFTRTQGRVNARAALNAPTTNATPLTDGNINGARTMTRTIHRQVDWPNDVNDVYRRRLVAGNRYRITLDGPPGKDFDLYVWSPGTTEIHQFTIGCFRRNGPCPALRAFSAGMSADEEVTFTVRKTGTFFLQVQGWYSGGRYTFSVRRV
jgi:subtilisin family serine protease